MKSNTLNKLLSSIFLLLIITSCSSGRLTFFQMADTQFGAFNANKEFSRETKNMEAAIAGANKLKPAFVVICGDLVNKPGDPLQIAEYKRIAAKLNPSIKLYNVSGNHDVGNAPTAESLAIYKQYFGEDRYSFRSGNVYGIVINSSLIKDSSLSPSETAAQELWLEKTLINAQNSGEKNIMVFTHHSFFLTNPDEEDSNANINLDRRKVYLDIFKKYGVKQIFAGHSHRNFYGRDGELEMITTGAVGKPLGVDSSGFRIVNVKGQIVDHQYFALDSLPEQLRFKKR